MTGFAKSPLETKDLIDMVGGSPLIIKLLESAQGKGVVSAETNKAAESVINAFKSLQANILVQEFIKEAEGKDIRCFVVDGKVVASIMREAKKGEFRSNIHQGGKAKKVKITPEEKKLAVKAAKIFKLDVLFNFQTSREITRQYHRTQSHCLSLSWNDKRKNISFLSWFVDLAA